MALIPEWRTIDERYAEIADSIPGFGGLFYDEGGRLSVYHTNRAALDGTTRNRMVRLLREARGGRSLPGDADIRVLEGRFNFRELLTLYRSAILPVIPTLDGVTTSDIDEVRHKIVIGVADEGLVAPVWSRLNRLRLPAGLIDVEVTGLATPEALLTDSLRPVPGGAQISWNIETNKCTFGYNLIRHVGGWEDTAATDRYFVTNSHCTARRNVLDNTVIRQYGLWIGSEIGDPAAFTNSYSSACPPTFACRWADAALFRFNDPAQSDHGRVAFPTLTTISFTSYWTITAVQPPIAGHYQSLGTQCT